VQQTDRGVPSTGGSLSQIVRWFGKAPAMVAVAVLEIVLGFFLAKHGYDTQGFANILWPVNIALYGGGAAKAWSKYRNGSSKQSSG